MSRPQCVFRRGLWLLLLLPGLAAGENALRQRHLPGYQGLALRFEPNRGQTDPEVQFLARGNGYTVFLARGETVFRLAMPKGRPARVVRLRWSGGDAGARAEGLDRLSGVSHYLIGNDPANWRTHIPQYARVRYGRIYPGVDLVFRSARGRIEYDLEVAPHADPGLIRLAVEGADRMRVDANGDLVLQAGGATLRQCKPTVYQETGGGRRILDGRYKLLGRRLVGFEVTGRDSTKALTIDPVLLYSTYLGGNAMDYAAGIALDSQGKAYVAGITASVAFPKVPGPQRDSTNGPNDVFVTKLNAAGTALEYSTILGGQLGEGASRIAVDAAGSAHIVGYTNSRDFPVTANAAQRAFGGGAHDAFVAKLTPDGSSLVYSTFLGGVDDDSGRDITLDRSGAVYAAGYTGSPDFPRTPGAFGARLLGEYDAFVVKLDPAKGTLLYSALLGGSGTEVASAVKVDAQGSAYVGGLTYSDNFPTTPGVIQPRRNGHDDSFLARLDPSGSSLIFATYLGGNCEEETYALALDREGNAYLTGYVETRNFPATPGAFQTAHAGGTDDAFVAKIDATGTRLIYSTYLGGRSNDEGGDIVVDADGNAYVFGYTESSDFPVTPAALKSSLAGQADAFLVKLNSRGSRLMHSTYLGGNNVDDGYGLAMDAAGDIYVAGRTGSSDFPVTAGAFQRAFAGNWEAFVTKLRLPTITTVSTASYAAGAPLAPDSAASGFGPMLAGSTLVAEGQPLPESLAGVTVTVRDSAGIERPSPLFFVSPTQINFLVPRLTATGPASVKVSNSGQVVSYGLLDVEPVAPGLLTANLDGRGAPLGLVFRVSPDGSRSWQNLFQCGAAAGSCVPLPVDLDPETDQVYLELYGTGFRGLSSLAAAGVRIGGVSAEVLYAGAQGSFAGLDQLDVLVPRSLRGRGEVDVVLEVDRRTSNAVRVNIR
jgi:uncharacterized protein (TIGR03437 family)